MLNLRFFVLLLIFQMINLVSGNYIHSQNKSDTTDLIIEKVEFSYKGKLYNLDTESLIITPENLLDSLKFSIYHSGSTGRLDVWLNLQDSITLEKYQQVLGIIDLDFKNGISSVYIPFQVINSTEIAKGTIECQLNGGYYNYDKFFMELLQFINLTKQQDTQKLLSFVADVNLIHANGWYDDAEQQILRPFHKSFTINSFDYNNLLDTKNRDTQWIELILKGELKHYLDDINYTFYPDSAVGNNGTVYNSLFDTNVFTLLVKRTEIRGEGLDVLSYHQDNISTSQKISHKVNMCVVSFLIDSSIINLARRRSFMSLDFQLVSSSGESKDIHIPIDHTDPTAMNVSREGMRVKINQSVAWVSLEDSLFKKLTNTHIMIASAVEGDEPLSKRMYENKMGFSVENIVKPPYSGNLLFSISGYDKTKEEFVSYSISLYFERN